jgi:hypothetical protein
MTRRAMTRPGDDAARRLRGRRPGPSRPGSRAARAVGSGAVGQWGGTAARRPGGAAARRGGGTAGRRHGGAAARRGGGTAVPRCGGAAVRRRGAAPLRQCGGAAVPQSAAVPRCRSAAVPQGRGAAVPRCRGAAVPRCRGATGRLTPVRRYEGPSGERRARLVCPAAAPGSKIVGCVLKSELEAVAGSDSDTHLTIKPGARRCCEVGLGRSGANPANVDPST